MGNSLKPSATLAPLELAITPEMEARGRYILYGFDRERDDASSVVRDVLLEIFEGSAFLIHFDAIHEPNDAR